MRYAVQFMFIGVALIGSFSTRMAKADAVHITSAEKQTYCLTVTDAKRTEGAKISLGTCGSGEHQRFEFTPSGEIRVYGDKCVGTAGLGRPHDQMKIGKCTGDKKQKWTRTSDSEIVGINGLCLEIGGDKTPPVPEKAIIQFFKCNKGKNQHWVMAKP